MRSINIWLVGFMLVILAVLALFASVEVLKIVSFLFAAVIAFCSDEYVSEIAMILVFITVALGLLGY